jgi:hypothetical protein
MQTQIDQALMEGAATGTVSLQITENQLTSFVALKLQERTNPPFTDPQILLRNGQMQMYAKLTQGMFNANILITMNVGLDQTTGLPKIEITTANFGPFPAPAGMNSAISAIIEEAFTGSLGPVAVGFRLQSISITNGVMTITGRIK